MKKLTAMVIPVVLGLLLLWPGCHSSEDTRFMWRGQVWKITWDKGTLGGVEISITDPYGNVFTPDDDRLPFNFNVTVNDGDVSITGGKPLSNGIRAAIAETAGYVYLLDIFAEDRILVLDQANAGLAASISVPVKPQGMTLSRDGRRLYVTHLGIADDNPFFEPAPPRVTVIDTGSHSITGTISLPEDVEPGDPVPSPDGRFLYVPNRGQFGANGQMDSSVLVVDTAMSAVVDEIPLNQPGQSVNALEITPDGALLYGIAVGSLPVRLAVIDTTTREVITSTLIFGLAKHLLINGTGSRLYVLTADTVSVIDTATSKVMASIPIGENARLNRLALSFDGGSLFVNHELEPAMTRIDTQTNQVVEEFPVGTQATDGSMIFMVP